MQYLMGRYTVSAQRARLATAHARARTAPGPFGYRRLRVLLQREGWEVGRERFYRVYTEEGLALRWKRPWRHATAVHREQRRPAASRNDIWSMAFVADQLADGPSWLLPLATTVANITATDKWWERTAPSPQFAR
jgi:hypothetical protein